VAVDDLRVERNTMNRRDFLLSTAVAVPLSTAITLTPKPVPRVRIWLTDWPADASIYLPPTDVARRPPTRCLTVAAQKQLPSWKLGDPLLPGMMHSAEHLQPGDAVAKWRVQDGDLLDPTTQVWVVCSVEVV